MSAGAEFVDYYAVLGVPENADDAAIERAINDLQRKWRPRQNNPDPRRRTEAEAMMRTVEGAEVTLKDMSRRAAFDATRRARLTAARAAAPAGPGSDRGADPHRHVSQQRHGGPQQQFRPPPPRPQPQPRLQRPAPSNNPWVRQTHDLLGRGATEAARVAAKRAVDASPSDPDSWSALGHALAALGRVQEAQAAFREAVAISPTAANRVNLARCRMSLGQYSLAFESLSAAYSRDPGNTSVREALILCYVEAGSPQLALPLAERLAVEHPSHQPYQRQLAWVLYKTTVSELTETSPGLYLITSVAQADSVRTRLVRAWNLHYDDDQLKAEIKKWYHVGEAASARSFNNPDAGRWFAWVVALVAGLLLTYSFWPVGIAYLAVLGGLFYGIQWRPQWQLNRRACEATGVTRWGL